MLFVFPGDHLPPRKKYSVLCDFDGTITVQDTAEWILDKHAKGDWRALDDCYVQGKISLLECMRDQFALVKADRPYLLEELDRDIILRRGFADLVDTCMDHQADVYVVSAGLDFVIEHFLRRLGVDDKVIVYSARTYDEDGHISFEFPPLIMPGAKTFKDDLVLQQRKKGYQVVYFGDGMPDTEACSIADHRFAVKDRRLEMELRKRGLSHHSFEEFLEVIPAVERILSVGFD